MSCISAGSSRFSYTCRLLGLMRCFCSASSWVLHLVGLVSTSPWLRRVDRFGGGIIACAHLCMQGWGGPILQIDGAALTLPGTRVGFPGLLLSSERLFGEGTPSCFSRLGLDFVLVVVHGDASSLPLRSCGGVIAGFVELANGESLAWRFMVDIVVPDYGVFS